MQLEVSLSLHPHLTFPIIHKHTIKHLLSGCNASKLNSKQYIIKDFEGNSYMVMSLTQGSMAKLSLCMTAVQEQMAGSGLCG